MQATAKPGPGDATPASTPTFRQRIRNFFLPARPDRPQAPALEPREVHTPAPAVKQTSFTGAKLGAAVPAPPAIAPRHSFNLAEKDLQQVGHEKDYSWITGKLFPAPTGAGRWVLCYAGQYEEDAYGGALVLTGAAELASYREGDLICVHGRVLGNAPTARSAASTAYEVTSVNLIERAAR